MLRALDNYLLNLAVHPELSGAPRFAVEFYYFGIKQVRACLFVGLFFAAVFSVPREGFWGIPRYDVLLIVAVGSTHAVAGIFHSDWFLHLVG